MSASQNKIFRFLDSNGDGTGTKDIIGDYQFAVEQFYFESDGFADIYRMIVGYEDTQGFNTVKFAIQAALPNGIVFKIVDADGTTTLLDLTDGIPIKNNADWAHFCYDVQVYTWGAGNERLAGRWTFSKSGSPIRLNPGQRLVAEVNDDLSGLIHMTFMVQGEYV